MLRIIIGILFVLHGLVHLLYLGQSRGVFELQPGMVWPDGSWAFSRLLGDEASRQLASASLVLAAVAFVAGGIGILLGQDWWQLVVVGASILSAVLYILFWDGRWMQMDDKGGVGLLIDVAVLAALLLFQRPV